MSPVLATPTIIYVESPLGTASTPRLVRIPVPTVSQSGREDGGATIAWPAWI